MKVKSLALLSFMFVAWGSLSQACPCVDKQTLATNLTYHQASLTVENAVIAKLKNPDLIAIVNASVTEDQAKITEINALSYNDGIPFEYTDLSQGFTTRANQALALLKNLPAGPTFDATYANFRAGEVQRLLTAFDTYFVLDVETPGLKVWAPQERNVVAASYAQSTNIEAEVKAQIEAANQTH